MAVEQYPVVTLFNGQGRAFIVVARADSLLLLASLSDFIEVG